MYITTYGSYLDAARDDLSQKIAVVIDTFRFTTTLTTALENGAKFVCPLKEVDDAFANKKLHPDWILGGERNAKIVPGFQAGNSPLEYTESLVKGKGLLITTTNGTSACEVGKSAKKMIAACFRNAAAVAEYLKNQDLDVALICSGTVGRLSMEDNLTAGLIAGYLNPKDYRECNDLTRMSISIYEAKKDCLKDYLNLTTHYHNMVRAGAEEDIPFCLEVNASSRIPVWNENQFI